MTKINLTQLRKRITEFTSVSHATAGPLRISVSVPTLLALIDTTEAAHQVWRTDNSPEPIRAPLETMYLTLDRFDFTPEAK